MQTPWFLDYLGLTTGADAADIKRAYAARLKRVDQVTDIAGFMRLREAYAAATAWSRHGGECASAMVPAAVETSAPDPHAPISVATRAFQQLAQQLESGDTADLVFRKQLGSLQGEHLQATAIFEAMLIDGLAGQRLPQRLALFRIARDAMDWNDILRMQQMGARGQWIRAAQEEEAVWEHTSQTMGCSDLFDRLGGVPALDRADLAPSHFTRDATLRWPDMQSLLQRYPHYLALRVERSALTAWEQAFAALPARDKVMAESFSNLPSPAAYRRSVPTQKHTSYRGPAGAVFAIVMALSAMSHMLSGPSAPPRAAPAVTSHQHAMPQRIAINADVCRHLERDIHAADWTPPTDALERRYLGDAVMGCIDTGDWPNLKWDDPRLYQLGIRG